MTTTPGLDLAGRDELNFAGVPNGVLSTRDRPSGRIDFPAVSISAGVEHELPGNLDEEVLVGLITMTHQVNGFADPRVVFAASAMHRLLGWTHGGYSHNRLDAALRRWVGVTFTFNNSWFDRLSGQTGSTTFNVLNEVEDGYGSRRARTYSVVWNDRMFASLQAGYVRSFDFDLYRRISSAVAKRLFRIFGRQAHLHAYTQRYDLRTLAFDMVGMAGRGMLDAGQIKQKLNKAIDHLEQVGFLSPSGSSPRYCRRGDGGWDVTVVVASGVGRAVDPPAPVISAEAAEILKIYKRHGVSDEGLAKLGTAHPAAYLREKLEIFNAAVRRNQKMGNAAGWLVRACENDYKPTSSPIDESKKATIVSAATTETEIDPTEDVPFAGVNDGERRRICEDLNTLYPEEMKGVIEAVPPPLRHLRPVVDAYRMVKLWELYKINNHGGKNNL